MIGVRVLSRTERPVSTIARAAGVSYGRSDPARGRVARCFARGHLSVFEHASITFEIEGISRACSHQLVRHRLFSIVQQSQRYCRIDTSGDEWFVRPGLFDDRGEFDAHMRACAEAYQAALRAGIPPEDARYLLPEACKTNIVVTANVRELFHFLDLRTDEHAQWEIRRLALTMLAAMWELGEEWRWLAKLYEDANGISESHESGDATVSCADDERQKFLVRAYYSIDDGKLLFEDVKRD